MNVSELRQLLARCDDKADVVLRPAAAEEGEVQNLWRVQCDFGSKHAEGETVVLHGDAS